MTTSPMAMTNMIREQIAKAQQVNDHQILDLCVAVDQLQRRVTEMEAKVADYENCISWDVTCSNCANLLDASIKNYERADRAETRVAELEAEVERLNERGG